MDPIEINGAKNVTDIATIINSKSPDNLAVLMFTASWCGPCKRIKQEIYGSYSDGKYVRNSTGLSTLFGKVATFYIIDIETNSDLLADENFKSVQAAPTFFFAKLTSDGKTKELKINKNKVQGGDKNKLVDGIKSCLQ
jgi:thiol-disulfide isomerase/thioredoxin